MDLRSGLLWIRQQNIGDCCMKSQRLRKTAIIDILRPHPCVCCCSCFLTCLPPPPLPCSSVPVMPHGGLSWTGSRCLTWTDRIASVASWTSRRTKALAGSCADTSSWTRSRAACCGTWTTHRCVCVCVKLASGWGTAPQAEGPAVLYQQK